MVTTSAVYEIPMLPADFTPLSPIEPDLLLIEVYITGIGNFLFLFL